MQRTSPTLADSRALAALRARYPEGARSAAVLAVDTHYGYTMEWAPSPEAHREEYDEFTLTLLAEFCVDPECPDHGDVYNRARHGTLCPLDT